MFDLSHLPNQRPNETVVFFLRPFWLSLVSVAAMMALLVFIPLIAALVFWDPLFVWLSDPLLGPTITVLLGMYFLAVWLFAFMQFADYYLDTWIVTTERVIDNEQHGLFNRTASELHLANIQDVTSEINGVLHTFFNYGDVFVQTAAEKERFTFHDVANPEKLKESILKLAEEDKRRHLSMAEQIGQDAL